MINETQLLQLVYIHLFALLAPGVGFVAYSVWHHHESGHVPIGERLGKLVHFPHRTPRRAA